jgi:hypothetical protein
MACKFFISLETGPPLNFLSELVNPMETMIEHGEKLDNVSKVNDLKNIGSCVEIQSSNHILGNETQAHTEKKVFQDITLDNLNKTSNFTNGSTQDFRGKGIGLEIRLEAKIYPYLIFIIKTIF